MMNGILKLSIAAMLPCILSVVIYLLDTKTAARNIPEKWKQLIIGILFGGLAVIGTEWGIPINGAQTNCRDAAVLTAGLLFGGPAGIIAGFIGGIERWFAVYWGIGYFTRIACTVSTCLAGFYAAFLRKFLFENKMPSVFLSFASGVVMEVIHLTMVFLTNMNTPIEAMAVVRACTAPMLAANALSVMVSAVLILMLSNGIGKKDEVRISQTIQFWLFVTVVFAFLATSGFVFSMQNTLADVQTDSLLSLALTDVRADISDTTDANILSTARKVRDEIGTFSLDEIAARYGISEINRIGPDGVIRDSTDPDFIGYDMASGAQSAEFLCLFDDRTEYVQPYGTISYNSEIQRKYAAVRVSDGFIQIGFDALGFQNSLRGQIENVTRNRHVGSTGFILILNEQGQIVSAPDDLALPDTEDLMDAESNQTYRTVVNGEECYCRYCYEEGYCIVSVLPKEEALQIRNIALYVNTFMEIIVFAVLFSLIYLLIKRVVVDQIKKVNGSLTAITAGDLDEVVDVRSSAEFASLSDDINATVDTLKRYIAEASARIDSELEFAKNIQSSALPSVFPAFPQRTEFDIFALMDPAKEVGGDFYDFYMTDSDTLHFLIADVSGKGIPAAMFMMRAKTELKSLTESGKTVSEVFTLGNNALCEGNDAGMFVTAWQGGVRLSDGNVKFANAGHNPPLIRHADGSFEYYRSRAGFVLAGMEDVRYKPFEITLVPGDIIFLYTDGVTEAQNAEHELYGEDRLLSAINAQEFETVRELCESVKADVDAFVGGAPQFDDITMVALRYFGLPKVPSMSFENAAISDITALTAFVEEELEKRECPMKVIMQISVAIDEIFSNIVNYAYPGTTGPAMVELLDRREPRAVALRFTDSGIPYNPVTKEDPDTTLSADERQIGGLGIFMVKKTMDEMKYEYENEKNIMTIVKYY